MLSFQIKEEIKKILDSFEKTKYFFDCLNSIDATFPDIDGYIQEIAAGGEKSTQAASRLRGLLANVRNEISNVKPRNFFASIEKLQSEINRAKGYSFNDLSQLEEIENKLNNFSHAYEAYLESYSPQSAGLMLIAARQLVFLLDGFKKELYFYVENIESSIPESKEGRELSIVLSSTMTFSEFILKLQSIEKIYNELCMLINVSTTEFPIQILKIESGSLWADVFGDTKVIVLMTNLIESGVGFVYRNVTTEGKLSSIHGKVDAIESIIELSEKLKAQDIDIEEIEEYISKVSVTIAKELDKLISGQSEIIINNNKLSVEDEAQKKLVQSNVPLKLELDDEQK